MIRIASKTVFDSAVNAMARQQAQLLKTQQQLAANRKMLTPADDPIASARALEVGQAEGINTQYGVNAKAASGRLALTEQSLARVVNLLQAARESTVAAGGGSLTDDDRRIIALDVRALREALLEVANSSDGEGNFLFSGFQTDVQPFAAVAGGVQYSGDDGERLVQVSAGRQIPVSESGAEVFMRIRQGNGNFVVSAPPGNAGSSTYSVGTVTDPGQLTGNQYRVVFTVAGAATTYDVIDDTTSATVLAAQPYTAGAAIDFDGMRLQVSGVPASGDEIHVAPSANQSLFQTIDELATLLETGTASVAAAARLTNGLADALVNLDQALEKVAMRRSLVGTRMREVETLQSVSEDLSIQYKQTLSQLQDLDYAKAVSDLIQQQTNLEAAQKTFVQTANLSIFNYI